MTFKKAREKNSSVPDTSMQENSKWNTRLIIITIWCGLLWVVICPIIYAKLLQTYSPEERNGWPSAWSYIYWGVAFVVFLFFVLALLVLLKVFSPHRGVYIPRDDYNEVFLNPEYGDDVEILCNRCSTFHIKGEKYCPDKISAKCCSSCGKNKESFNSCCQKPASLADKVIAGPKYEVYVQKQQPEDEIIISRRKKLIEEKRNSLKSDKRKSSGSSSIIITTHDNSTKNIKTKNFDVLSSDKIEKTIKTKKPPNLQPVDVELANRYSSIEFFGEKVPLKGDKENLPEPTPKTVSVSSMESMGKEKFKDYLHLVEVNTPPTSDVIDSKPPLSPREIFFYDMIHATDKTEDSPDCTKYEKKRPVSHILLTTDVNLNFEDNKEKIDELKWQALEKGTKPDNEADNSKSVIKVLHTIKKETITIERPRVVEMNSNKSSMSEQMSTHENLNTESVSKYFISDIGPQKPSRISSADEKTNDKSIDTKRKASLDDEVFKK